MIAAHASSRLRTWSYKKVQRSRASASRVCQSKRGEERVTEKTGERLEKQKRAREKERGMGSESNAEGIKIGRGGEG